MIRGPTILTIAPPNRLMLAMVVDETSPHPARNPTRYWRRLKKRHAPLGSTCLDHKINVSKQDGAF